MSRISEVFDRLQREGRKALIPFVTAGDPSLEDLPGIISALQEGGADLIEVGLPFSDPIADGPTIQASSQRALDRGVTVAKALDAIAAAKPEVPIIAMGYLNPMMAMGLDKFCARAKSVGVEGVIVCDLTPDEGSAPWIDAATKAGLDRIFLSAPTSTDDRLAAVAAQGTGFIYAVSRTGVTGAGSQAPPQVVDLVNRIRKHTSIPVCVGFGISQPEHVAMVCQAADGAVVGSSLVDLLAKDWNGGAGRDGIVEFIRSLKEAAR